MRRLRALVALAALAAALVAGCSYTTTSNLPSHIRTISVGMFGNTTHYLNLEGVLTKELIRAVNLTPGYQVVNGNADAELSGEIINVRNVVTQYDSNNQPKEMRVAISVRYSLYDNVANEFIIVNSTVRNTQSSTLAGEYVVDSGNSWTSAAEGALAETARLIVRQIMVRKTQANFDDQIDEENNRADSQAVSAGTAATPATTYSPAQGQ